MGSSGPTIEDGPRDEADRRPARSGRALERRFDDVLRWLARHWLALIIGVSAVFVALPVLAPVLAANGYDRASGWIYTAYRFTCHQLPHHSYLLGGSSATVTWPQVADALGLPADQPLSALFQPLRDPGLGYQLAICQRDIATYVAWLASAVAFALLRRRRTIDPLPLKLYILALVPLALDGGTQLIGLRESTPLLRTLTGALFGVASALLILPTMDAGFREVLELHDRATENPRDANRNGHLGGSGF